MSDEPQVAYGCDEQRAKPVDRLATYRGKPVADMDREEIIEAWERAEHLLAQELSRTSRSGA